MIYAHESVAALETIHCSFRWTILRIILQKMCWVQILEEINVQDSSNRWDETNMR